MKYMIILLLLLQTGISHAASNSELRIDTDEGYPYKNLIKKTRRIEIRYVESNKKIKCKVNIYTSDNLFSGGDHIVNNKKFEKRPMASCLGRAKAKEILGML